MNILEIEGSCNILRCIYQKISRMYVYMCLSFFSCENIFSSYKFKNIQIFVILERIIFPDFEVSILNSSIFGRT